MNCTTPIKHVPPPSTQGMADAMPVLVPKVRIQEAPSSSAPTEKTGLRSGHLGLWLCSNPITWGSAASAQALAALGGALVSPHPHPGTSELGPCRGRGHLKEEGELREQLDEAQHPRACSSITKAKMTSCVPSRGMRSRTWRAWGRAGTSF